MNNALQLGLHEWSTSILKEVPCGGTLLHTHVELTQ